MSYGRRPPAIQAVFEAAAQRRARTTHYERMQFDDLDCDGDGDGDDGVSHGRYALHGTRLRFTPSALGSTALVHQQQQQQQHSLARWRASAAAGSTAFASPSASDDGGSVAAPARTLSSELLRQLHEERRMRQQYRQ